MIPGVTNSSSAYPIHKGEEEDSLEPSMEKQTLGGSSPLPLLQPNNPLVGNCTMLRDNEEFERCFYHNSLVVGLTKECEFKVKDVNSGRDLFSLSNRDFCYDFTNLLDFCYYQDKIFLLCEEGRCCVINVATGEIERYCTIDNKAVTATSYLNTLVIGTSDGRVIVMHSFEGGWREENLSHICLDDMVIELKVFGSHLVARTLHSSTLVAWDMNQRECPLYQMVFPKEEVTWYNDRFVKTDDFFLLYNRYLMMLRLGKLFCFDLIEKKGTNILDHFGRASFFSNAYYTDAGGTFRETVSFVTEEKGICLYDPREGRVIWEYPSQEAVLSTVCMNGVMFFSSAPKEMIEGDLSELNFISPTVSAVAMNTKALLYKISLPEGFCHLQKVENQLFAEKSSFTVPGMGVEGVIVLDFSPPEERGGETMRIIL